jgi:hypothetical protein
VPKSPSQSGEFSEHTLSPGLSSKTILNLLPVRKNSPGSVTDQRRSDRERTNSAGSVAEVGSGRRKSDNATDSGSASAPKKSSSTIRSMSEL